MNMKFYILSYTSIKTYRTDLNLQNQTYICCCQGYDQFRVLGMENSNFSFIELSTKQSKTSIR